ncbi:hypothetical protein WJX77_001281 [Trebouxia sp. C0004]
MLLSALALGVTEAAGGFGFPEIELKHQTRTLLQALAPAPSPSSALTLQAGPGDIQIAGAVELRVTCPFVVPFNQASQVLITDSLQAVLPPNTTIGQVNMMQQLSNDTVIVSTQFSIWESQLPILLANKCCALEDLYLQYAVQRISPSITGQNVSITLINWTIGDTSMQQAPAAAPGAAPSSPAAATTTAPAAANTAAMPPLGPGQVPGNPGPPLPSGQAVRIDPSTPFFLGGITAGSTPQQAMANFTVVDVAVRTIATKNNTLAATVQLAIAHRYAVKTLMWSMGVQVEVLNMTNSSNMSMVPSVDFLNRLWVPNDAPSPAAFVQTMLLTATAAPAQYAALMNQSGFSVDVDVLDTTVIGTVANATLPSIEVVPPSNGFNITWSALLMTLEITSSNFTPFTYQQQLLLTALTTQVLQQYGANFVSIQSYNSTESVSGSSRRLFRKLLSHQLAAPSGSHHGRHLAQANTNASLVVNMLVTVPADQQLQVLSPGTIDKVSQALAASGYPSNVTLVAAALDVVGGPFGRNANVTASKAAVGTPSTTPSQGGGISKGKKDAAIAVPVTVGSLLAALLALLLLFVARRRSMGRAGSKGIVATAPEGKRRAVGSGQNGAGVMDTARIQSTGGADSPMRTGGGDGYDTDMDDKMGLARSPSRHPLQDPGLDIQATQAGAVTRVLGRMHAREQEVSNALAETSTFVMNHFQAGSVLRKKYSLTGWRWRSPSAIWCGADQVEEPWAPVGLKMYALTSNFIREKELLDMPYSSEHWPKVFDTYTYSDVGFDGDACPPCIVMQPPVATLQTWLDAQDQTNPVWEEQVATLYNLCKALQSFHVRGMVHCSLAPLTFSWFQGGQGWKVAACGDWAQAGMHVRSCYQLRYASPEAVQGDLFDVAGAAADPAMDMWALGAIAFEIFTGRGLFSRRNYTDNDVINMLLGFENLPSESQPAFWHQIRDTAAQRLVQNLLRRVPDQRSTINEVLASPIFNAFTQPSNRSKTGRRSLWSQEFVAKLSSTGSSLRSMDTRMSDELQPRQAGPLLDAHDRNGAQTASEESIKSKDLKDTSSIHETGSLHSAESADRAALHSK